MSTVQGAGRVDNPGRYRTLYCSDSAAGAVAEAFGNHAIWTPLLLRGRTPGSVRALAEIESKGDHIVDLDDAHELVRRQLRPSAVVTRDRTVTQRWALAVFEEKRSSGVRWWSYYDSRWGSFGLWRIDRLRVRRVRALTPDDPALLEAASTLSRPWRAET
ncbi:MAG TPA: RES family NAD+ phosphorylase [Candidatus Polarisedimenticolaceae bacterium]|nr:RES family NAD+ phosphorylase [Candidatus Polarisedimenticolaceae bacterium]